MAKKKTKKKKWTPAMKEAFVRRMKAARRKKSGISSVKKKTTKISSKRKGAPVAKKGKKSSTAKRRRRRSGFRLGRGQMARVLTDTGLAIGGGITASFVANQLPFKQPVSKALVPIGVGLATLMFGPRRLPYALPLGMVAIGGLSLVRSQFPQLPLLAGEEEMVVVPRISNRPNGVPVYGGGVEEIGVEDIGEESYVTPADM